MILAIDAGNSRIKWGMHDGRRWLALGAAGHEALPRIEAEWRALPRPEYIAVSNVAGQRVRAEIERLTSAWGVVPQWIVPTRAAGGVRNEYEEVGQLGVDRWAAVVAARARCRGNCVVVIAGTATTVNLLDRDGVFRGGLILPGVALMKQALNANTAALPLAAGRYLDQPRNTVDAIESGCLHATVGAIERMRARLAVDAACLLSGGAAHALLPLIAPSVELVEDLVLDGVRLIVEEAGAAA